MENELKNALRVLRKGGTIVYPTDTIWGVGCDATNRKAVGKVYQIKMRPESKSLILLVDSHKMLKEVVQVVPDQVLDFLMRSDKSTTVIYKNPVGIADNAVASDNTVAIRVVDDDFCRELIREFGKPIVSTSANVSGEEPPAHYGQINPELLEKADYIVNLSRNKIQSTASQIVKINDLGEIEFLRK